MAIGPDQLALKGAVRNVSLLVVLGVLLTKVREIAATLKAIQADEDIMAARLEGYPSNR